MQTRRRPINHRPRRRRTPARRHRGPGRHADRMPVLRARHSWSNAEVVVERAGVLEDYILAEMTMPGETVGRAGTPGATGTSGTAARMYKVENIDDSEAPCAGWQACGGHRSHRSRGQHGVCRRSGAAARPWPWSGPGQPARVRGDIHPRSVRDLRAKAVESALTIRRRDPRATSRPRVHAAMVLSQNALHRPTRVCSRHREGRPRRRSGNLLFEVLKRAGVLLTLDATSRSESEHRRSTPARPSGSGWDRQPRERTHALRINQVPNSSFRRYG